MNDEVFLALKKSLPGIQKNILLKDHTTFQIGGPAKYFLVAQKKEDIIKALTLAKQLNLPVFILGGGSNILASDQGFDGLVIKIQNKKPSLKIQQKAGNFFIEAPAGTAVKDLVTFSTNNALQGLEWAGGLPGTFGGAIRGNAGAFGGETKDSIFQVQALDENLNIKIVSNAQCQFSYRNSIFKQKNWIVLSATIKLTKGDKKNLKATAKANADYRTNRHPLNFPNAGSIFKNCDFESFSLSHQKNLLAVVKKDPFPVVPTAYLISEAGLKGTTIGGAKVSEKHPNFIVNVGGAKAKDVLAVIDINKKNIKEKYNVTLEQEVQYLS